MMNTLYVFSILFLASLLSACSGVSGDNTGSTGRVSEPHAELKIVDVSGSSASKVGAKTNAKTSVKDPVQSNALAIGSLYLESQIKPLTVNGTALQASDISVYNGNVYVAYNAFDTNGVVVKKGAVEQLTPLVCQSGSLRASYCTNITGKIDFPNADIFGIDSDANYLYAVGSTSDESAAPSYARLYKIGLNSSNKSPTSVISTTNLPSYAGTSVLSLGSTILATSGTSTDSSKMGGLSFINPTTMAVTSTQPLYDARGVAAYKPSTSNPTTVFVTRGKVDSGNLGAVVEYKTDGTGSALRTINTGGNTIPESKSNIQVGNQLILVSLGDQGFKVVCKATGATLLTKAAPVVSGIPASRTVTNSVAAAPGYIFAANGEAGLYVYQFSKSSFLNTNYCQGVTATLLGRLSLDSDDNDSTYINSEISANSVYYLPVFNLLNIITARLIVVASGNKGVSLINITSLLSLSDDVDDF